ncbi:MAG: chemotaxis protein CheX [Armatimonadota bacterium]
MTDLQTNTQQIPDELSECVRQSVLANFEMMLGTELSSRDSDGTELPSEGITGIISLIGDVSWSLMVCLPRDTATAIAVGFVGFEVPFESADMGDVVGELANILAGDISARLDALGIKAALSLPTVLRGKDIDLLLPEGTPSVRHFYDSSLGQFSVRITAGAPSHMRKSGE